ncbi:uncharacterized protein LOC115007924 isoform X4 [Cottoperca gobio]|uniref:Uncharacterized protein LOC115007922 isoform X4 n=2 Tax=Cottoperca gobio TaxID=56716 RepID=A0A6J2PNM6_COTGO|nr:uncharacterized protein LOC115007922 isoform X4 [Cottoperca gobio]XP_029286936.1 uncharacterized protein LOC115007924 isoform X4 [Cottoperca gobio]
MAGRRLLVIFIYSFLESYAQALLPPTLTVNPPVISETDSVTLHCQTPSSVPVSQCYFKTMRTKRGKVFPCLKTLTGTELLEMSHQSSPAEVKVTCFYLHATQSPESNISSIIIRTSLPPTLTVNPPVISETDSVTLHCQTPSSVPVSQCHFYTLSGETVKDVSCLKTLTGTELLEMSHQSSPAEVEMTCFYTVKLGESHYLSPHSDTSSVTIHSDTSSVTIHSLSVSTPGTKDSSYPATSQKTASATWILNFIVVVAGCGVTVAVILLVSAILWNKKRTAGERREPQNENLDAYPLYCSISEEPAASELKGVMYSTVQTH